MSTAEDFLDSLVEGDLVAARVQSSTKLHLVHVVRRTTPEMFRGTPSGEVTKWLFDCRPVCLLRPRYFWTPVADLETWSPQDRCAHCWQIWRRKNRPTIKGAQKVETPVASPLRLPWGWREVTPTGHPLDLPLEADDPDPEADENKVGSKRIEIRRWLRGTRYVRLTQDLKDGRIALRHGVLEDKPENEHWWYKGSLQTMLPHAVALMALGGKSNHATKVKLTLRDVTRGE